jgi:type IV pilus assembly protein PilC
MKFSYQLTNHQGKIMTGQLEADNLREARSKVILKDGTIISLEPVVNSHRPKERSGFVLFNRLRLLEKVMLAKHLSVMIKAGMPIDGALEVLKDDASPALAQKLTKILAEVRIGNSLSSALRKHPRDFDLLFVNMVAVGEQGGTLAKNLNILATQQQKSYELKNKLKSASIYPSLILLTMVALIVVISIFVLPKITNFFSTLKVQLPLSTRILMAVAGWFASYWWWVVVGLVFIFIFIHLLLRLSPTRFFLHKIILHLPIFGKIARHMSLALFCRTLASLLDSGITIDKALQITAQTMTNEVYKKEALTIYHNILKGNALSDTMSQGHYFPSLVARMSKVGEKSGNMSEVLEYLASFYELEVDTATKNLSTLLEPALLVVIGLAVGFVAMSIINPIYDLTSKVGR